MTKEKDSEKTQKINNAREENGNIADRLAAELARESDRIGNILCHERLKKGLELEDIAQVLCIRRGYLEAIESGNYVELPPLPYSAGFVSSYAKYLGLNHVRIAQLFREELNVKPDDKKVFLPDDMAAEASLPDKKYVIGGLAALLVIGGVWSWLVSGGEENKAEETADAAVETLADEGETGEIEYFSSAEENVTANEESTADEAGADEISAEAVAEKEQTSLIEPQAESLNGEEPAGGEKEAAVVPAPAKIEIKISKEDTWIEVRDPDKIYFNKVMHPGESYVVPEGKGMVLSAGKYDGVEVYINGRLTEVVKPNKKMNIALDPFVEAAEEH